MSSGEVAPIAGTTNHVCQNKTKYTAMARTVPSTPLVTSCADVDAQKFAASVGIRDVGVPAAAMKIVSVDVYPLQAAR